MSSFLRITRPQVASSFLIVLVALVLGQQNVVQGQGMAGLQGLINSATGGLGGSLAQAPLNLVESVTRPLTRGLSGINTATGGLPILGQKFNEISDHPLTDTISLGSGMLQGIVSGTAAASGLSGVSNSILGAASPVVNAAAAGLAAGHGAVQGVVQGALGSGLSGATAGVLGATAAGALSSQAGYYGGLGNEMIGARIGEEAALAGAAQTGIRAEAELGASRAGLASSAAAAAAPLTAANQIVSRQALAADAMANAHAESAIAGADMMAHGANNARSASLASNAYRQAKLAGARDRVNIAGTIQNSARISDAAIATHDSATKAEDSLLGSELAVDSAGTVLDSDAAYIPPVTNSLLRSLPYGRLGLRNIVPKPLTYPSVMLPDVWLNGRPVNYLNVPFGLLPYGVGPAATYIAPPFGGLPLPNGLMNIGQPLTSYNGVPINGLVVDPTVAYLNSNMYGIIGSSILPVLAYGQLEAQDEIGMANALTLQQQTGAGTSTTYQGYGRLNPVPMLTGSVTDVNLAPTTTIGTTYPIGSALVIEPRDSYFQDYVDNASSRQNYDERQQ